MNPHFATLELAMGDPIPAHDHRGEVAAGTFEAEYAENQRLRVEIDRLNAIIDKSGSVGYGNAVTMEIERLQAQIEKWKRCYEAKDAGREDLRRRCNELVAENNSLRIALNDIAAWSEGDRVTSQFDEPASAQRARLALGLMEAGR